MAVVKTSGDIIVTERYAYHTLCNALRVMSVENVVVWLVGFVGWQNSELLSEYLGCLPSIRQIVIIFICKPDKKRATTEVFVFLTL